MSQPAASRILSHAFGGISGRAAAAIFATLNILLLALVLEPRDYGIYLLFIRTISLVTLLGDLGQGQSAMAHFSLFAAVDRRLLGKFARIVLVSSAVTCLVAAILLLGARETLVPDLPPALLWLLVATIPATIFANVWSGVMVGAGHIWPLNIVRAITGALFLLGTLIFVVLLDGGLAAALLAYCGVTLIQAAAMLALARYHSGEGAAPQPSTAELIHFGLRSHANAVFYLIWTTLPLFVLTAYYGPAAAGVFGLGTQIVDKLMLPAHALHEAVYQRLRHLSREDAALEAAVYAASIFAVAAATSLVMAPLVYWVMPALLGEAYQAIGPASLLLLAGLPFMSGLLLLDPYFVNALQRPGLASWLGAGQVVIVAALSALIIPISGILGAAASLVLAQAIGLAVALLVLKRLSGLGWPSLAAAVATAARNGPAHVRQLALRRRQQS